MKKITTHRFILLFIFIFFGNILSAQTDEVLTNQSVIDLYQLGLGESVVINKIKTSKSNFDITVKGLTDLKKNGLTEAILNAMVEYADKNRAASEQNPNDPLTIHPAGIYYFPRQDTSVLVELESTLASDTKTNNFLAKLTHGMANTAIKRCLAGVTAKTKLKGHQPVFYFYIPESDDGASKFSASSVANSPNDFVLIQFMLNPNQNERCVVVGSHNDNSAKAGVDNSRTVSFQFQKVKKGVYRITMENSLEPGEYCFMYANNDVSKVFDFSIQ